MYHLLAGSVEDVKKTGFSVNDDLLPVAVLDGGVILVYEVVLDELDGEGGLADSASCNESGCYVSTFSKKCSTPPSCFTTLGQNREHRAA